MILDIIESLRDRLIIFAETQIYKRPALLVKASRKHAKVDETDRLIGPQRNVQLAIQ